jgi:hypothetical protein
MVSTVLATGSGTGVGLGQVLAKVLAPEWGHNVVIKTIVADQHTVRTNNASCACMCPLKPNP